MAVTGKAQAAYNAQSEPHNVTGARLTALLRSGRYSAGHVNRQCDSRLFTLPLKIRLEIWKHVFGGHVIFKESSSRQRGGRCAPKWCSLDAWILWFDVATRVSPYDVDRAVFARDTVLPGSRARDILPALQVCRLLYEDAWSGPFRWNVFHIECVEELYNLVSNKRPHHIIGTLLPDQVDAIRLMSVHYSTPRDPAYVRSKSGASLSRRFLKRPCRTRLGSLEMLVVLGKGMREGALYAEWSGRRLRAEMAQLLYTPKLQQMLIVAVARDAYTAKDLDQLAVATKTGLRNPTGFRFLRRHSTLAYQSSSSVAST